MSLFPTQFPTHHVLLFYIKSNRMMNSRWRKWPGMPSHWMTRGRRWFFNISQRRSQWHSGTWDCCWRNPKDLLLHLSPNVKASPLPLFLFVSSTNKCFICSEAAKRGSGNRKRPPGTASGSKPRSKKSNGGAEETQPKKKPKTVKKKMKS